jgi:hypothetical protein
VHVLQLTVDDEKSIAAFAVELAKQTKHVDLLINNAGINQPKDTPLEGSFSLLLSLFATNAVLAATWLLFLPSHRRVSGVQIGPLMVAQAVYPLLQAASKLRGSSSPAKVVNISSFLGQRASHTAEWQKLLGGAAYSGYRASKGVRCLFLVILVLVVADARPLLLLWCRRSQHALAKLCAESAWYFSALFLNIATLIHGCSSFYLLFICFRRHLPVSMPRPGQDRHEPVRNRHRRSQRGELLAIAHHQLLAFTASNCLLSFDELQCELLLWLLRGCAGQAAQEHRRRHAAAVGPLVRS